MIWLWKDYLKALGKINEALDDICVTDVTYDYSMKIKSEVLWCYQFFKKSALSLFWYIFSHLRIQASLNYNFLKCKIKMKYFWLHLFNIKSALNI